MTSEKEPKTNWVTISHLSYLGKSKDEQYAIWDKEYGKDNWQIAWQLATGEVLGFDQIFQHYVDGYILYFNNHLSEAQFLTDNYSYGYDKDPITKEEAFNPYALVNVLGRPNQFHHAALNIALEFYLNLEFKGQEPIQVREGKPNTDPATWPVGWRWSPSRIPATHPELIPLTNISSWWQKGSIEDLYQSAKILQIRK